MQRKARGARLLAIRLAPAGPRLLVRFLAASVGLACDGLESFGFLAESTTGRSVGLAYALVASARLSGTWALPVGILPSLRCRSLRLSLRHRMGCTLHCLYLTCLRWGR